MEVVNRLLNYKDLNIVQNTDWFNFSLDSVLLANFALQNKSYKNITYFNLCRTSPIIKES